MKKTLLLGIIATTVAFTSSTARAGDLGVRFQIGLPIPRILLPPPPRPFFVAPSVGCYPAPRPVYCPPPVVYHRYDRPSYHGRVHYRPYLRDNRHSHNHGHRRH